MKTLQVISIFLIVVGLGCKDDVVTNTATNSLVDIMSKEHFDTSVQSGVSLVFYHASWCSKCAAQRPAVEAVSEEAEFLDVFFAEVEYEDFSSLVEARGIQGFPTVVIYKDNKEEKRFSGQGHSQEEISNAVKAALN